MAFKDVVIQDTPNRYVMPKVGKMHCQVTAFLSPKLFDMTEEMLWQQAYNAATSYPGTTAVYLMPDCHIGYHVPIGSVIVTDGVIAQAGSGYDISCFTADTKVPLVDGRTMSFRELTEAYGDGGKFYVYSMTPGGKVTAGLAHSPRKTRRNAPLIEIELDNGEVTKCTPDHEWMLRDGTYRKAGSLQPGDSLMPLYRSYNKDGYCDVAHPCDGSTERMYKVSFLEMHGYVPKWPSIVHHDLFMGGNPNPSKTNDDPRFLREMDQKEHFRLHADTARRRAKRGEIGWGRLHQVKPEQMSRMGSENMTRLHQDPDFCARRDYRASEMNRRCREAGKYNENWAGAGSRGRRSLISYNKSDQGRERSRQVGLSNKGRTHSDDTRAKMREAHARANQEIIECPHCGRVCKGKGGYKRHLRWTHNNHKVVAVRPVQDCEDVYCMTVEKYKNFALSSGVFVHNCGMIYLKVPGLKADAIADLDVRRAWIDAVELRVATGLGSERPEGMGKRPTLKNIQEVLRYGAKTLGISPDLCERQYIPVDEQHFKDRRVKRAIEKAGPQLGSLGGGNHFIEMQVDPTDSSVWVMVHCGSRGYGWQTAEYYFHRGAEHRGIQDRRREESWLSLDEPLGQEFWAHHNSAANYAIANRWTIVEGLREATQEVLGATLEPFYEISHNLTQKESIVPAGGQEGQGIVHRKGATRAMPAGHPDLNRTCWKTTGHPILIPGSMLVGAAILRPTKLAWETGCSVNHGSGRVLGRGQAKREFKAIHDDIDAEMAEAQVCCDDGTTVTGILSNHKRTPLDECGWVYKDLDEVLQVLEDRGVANVEKRLYPVANIKGIG